MKKACLILLYSLLLCTLLISCQKKEPPKPKEDLINIFEDFYLGQSKESVLSKITDKEIPYKTYADYAKPESEMTEEEKEKMPEDYYSINTSVFLKDSDIKFYFWEDKF